MSDTNAGPGPVPYKRHERELLREIDGRDKAEQAMSQAYYIVTGHSPEWSNHFGYDEALSDIADAVALLKSTARAAGAASSADVLREVREAMSGLLASLAGSLAGMDLACTVFESLPTVKAARAALAKLPNEAPPASSPRA